MPRTGMTRKLLALAAALALLMSACSDDGDDTADTGDTAPTTTAASGDDNGTDDGDDDGDGTEPLVVGAIDYAYTDLPDTIDAGTTVVMRNDSEVEVHEILALLVPEGEDRTMEELLALDPEEAMQILEMRGVALAPPGTDSSMSPVPPLVLEQPGRYIFACMLPTDGPVDEVMAAVADYVALGEDAPPGGPAYPETGPPHVVQGMVAEVMVVG